MKHLVILGGGTAGTIVANKFARALPLREWRITVVDRDNDHVYQPGLLFVPFHRSDISDLVRSRRRYLHRAIELRMGGIVRIDHEHGLVVLDHEEVLPYDFLVIATGMQPNPGCTDGMLGPEWHQSVAEFYTFEGCMKLRHYLESWRGGRLIVNIARMPIKAPLAPLEFAFLADEFFRLQRMRLAVDIEFVTPQPAVFDQPIAARH